MVTLLASLHSLPHIMSLRHTGPRSSPAQFRPRADSYSLTRFIDVPECPCHTRRLQLDGGSGEFILSVLLRNLLTSWSRLRFSRQDLPVTRSPSPWLIAQSALVSITHFKSSFFPFVVPGHLVIPPNPPLVDLSRHPN